MFSLRRVEFLRRESTRGPCPQDSRNLPGGRCPTNSPLWGVAAPKASLHLGAGRGQAAARPLSLALRFLFLVFFEFVDLSVVVFGCRPGGRYVFDLLATFHIECTKNHAWGSYVARHISIFVKIARGYNYTWKLH